VVDICCLAVRAHEAGSVEAGSVDKLSVGAFVAAKSNLACPWTLMDDHGRPWALRISTQRLTEDGVCCMVGGFVGDRF
jgi:hypothetical protein